MGLKTKQKNNIRISNLPNIIGWGDSANLIKTLPDESINLIFTSPPYYNARPEYAIYNSYQLYLKKMRKIIHECHRVLSEGRFIIINVSPVLIPRDSRNKNSCRLAIPFDFHGILIKEGFDFIDDIIWVKPDACACNRNKNFQEYRNPLGYKANPVTENILVYRKHTERTVDYFIKNHPDREAVKNSKVVGEFEKTNIWKITPAHCKEHPAIFPQKLAEEIIRLYSFVNDVIFDPFGGTGTTAKAALKLKRRFVTFERKKEYANIIKNYFKNLGLFTNKIDIKFIKEK